MLDECQASSLSLPCSAVVVKRKPRQNLVDTAEAPFELVCFGVFTDLASLLTMPCGRTMPMEASCFSGKAGNLYTCQRKMAVFQQIKSARKWGKLRIDSNFCRRMDGFPANHFGFSGQMRGIFGFFEAGEG